MTFDYTLGVPLSETGPNGAATTVSAEYDSFGRLTKLIRPGDSSASPTLSIGYTNSNPFIVTLTQKIDPTKSFNIARRYDGLGRPTLVTANNSILVNYTYGYENGARVDKQSMPHTSAETAYWMKVQYDSLARPVTVTAPDGTTTSYAYNGLETTATDGNGNVTSTLTDILGKTLSVNAPAGPDLAFDYYDIGTLKTATRAGNTVTMTYDKAGRKIAMDDPDMGVWSYAYDALGNLTSQTDARGCTLTLTYDNLNRLDAKSSSGTCGQQINVNYDYDEGTYGIGFRTSMDDGTSTNPTSWEYDVRGRLAKEIKRIDSQSFTAIFTYNSADLPTSMTYPDGEVVNYEYNARMMLDTVIGNSTYVSDTQYDSAGRMTSRSLGNGLTQNFAYYDWNEKVNNIGQGGRLETLVTGSLQNLSYVYDKVGNVKQITNSIAGETSVYGYDELNRLTSWQLNQDPVENYSYDSAGNLDVKNGLDLEYDDANHVHAVTSAGVNTYSYDDNGNQTTRNVGGQTVQLDYDAENRLVSVTGTNLSAQFYYNGDGQRVKSVINDETTYFAGGHFEFNDTTDEVTKHYFAGASRIAVRKYIVPQSTTLNYLLGDHLGSTSVVTNETGALVVETRYKPWGEVRFTTDDLTLPTRYTFTGQYSHLNDSATDLGAAGFGLMFYNARWYDPALGRFAQADTIVPNTIQGLDRYAYVSNSPLVYLDPSGHLEKDKVKKLLGIEDLTDDEFATWLEANSDLRNALLAASVGDMLVFMSVVNGETVYQQYIIGEDEDGNYVFWGLDNNQCEGVCLSQTESHTYESQQEVLEHIQSGSEWGLYELDPDSSMSSFTFKLKASSYGFIAQDGTITLDNSESWKRAGSEGIRFHREIAKEGYLALGAAAGLCYKAGPWACGLGLAAAVITALATTTTSGPVYYPEYPRHQ